MAKKLKILHIGFTPPNPTYSNDAFVFQELRNQADVIFIDIVKLKNINTINDTIQKTIKNNKFDLIYKNYIKKIDTIKLRPLYEYNLPIFISSGDCHSRLMNDTYKQKRKHHKYNIIVVNNKSAISCFQDYFSEDLKYIHLPWSYNESIHKDYGHSKILDLSIPATSLKINLRNQIHNYLLNQPYKYEQIKGLDPIRYAQRINESKIGISTCQIENKLYYKNIFIGMTFNKYFEIPMCGSLHIAQESADSIDLGFIDGENIVTFKTFEEFKDKYKYYLDHENERNRIILNARKLVESMTYKNRITQFLLDARKNI